MATKKREKKRHVPRDPANCLIKTQPWRLNAVFDPLTSILDQMERDGTKDVASNGVAIFKDVVDGHWYDSAVAIMGVVDAFEIHEKRAGITINLEPLRKLAKKLEVDMPIFASDTQEVRECFNRMRQASMTMTIGYAQELIRDTQIQEAAQKLQEAR